MGHYNGKEFEKILQEAQANMMKGIPSLEIEENPALSPDASGEQADIHNLVESSSGTNLTQMLLNHPNMTDLTFFFLYEHTLNYIFL